MPQNKRGWIGRLLNLGLVLLENIGLIPWAPVAANALDNARIIVLIPKSRTKIVQSKGALRYTQYLQIAG